MSPGFANGAPGAAYTLLHALGAFRDGADGLRPKAAGQIVQYVSAHDNYTLWDKLKCVAGRGDFAAPDISDLDAGSITKTCIIAITVDEDGHAHSRVKQTSGNPEFDSRCREICDRKRFKPAVQDHIRHTSYFQEPFTAS